MSPLICPLCRGGLTPVAGALRCPAGHSFDVSREGYVNLLSGGRQSATMGDAREMLAARRAFLERGHYRPLSDAVNTAGAAHAQMPLIAGDPVCIVDVGCGEGYYLGRLKAQLDTCQQGTVTRCFGVDVSRDAVRMAARRHKDIRFVVSDAWRLLPFGDGSLDVLLSIFSPRNPTEFNRVLGPDGLLVIAIPEPHHLHELRSLEGFLDIQRDKRDALVQQFSPWFARLEEHTLEYKMSLGGDDLRHLTQMTPSHRHLTGEALAKLDAMGGAEVTAAFRVLAFCR